MDRTRFLPVRRRELLPLLLDEREDDAAFAHTATLLHHILCFESDRRIEALHASYTPFDPDPLAPSLKGEDDDAQRFLDNLEEVLEEANYRRVDSAELEAAFATRSLFSLHAEVDLDEYDILHLYRRGVAKRQEHVRTWLRRTRVVEVEYYERLVVALRLRPEALAAKDADRTEGMEEGRIYLKAFKNIPKADLEMVLPNTRLRMRPLDRFLVGGPLVAGIGWTLFQSLSLLLAVATGAFALSLDDNRVRAMGGVLLVLAGYVWRTHSKVKTTRLQYLRTLSQGLYFRNLANNRAVLDQALAFAQDEEEKEVLLAYHFLTQEPLSTDDLDARAEAWVRKRTGRDVDFDVHDGLQRLEGLGLVRQQERRWVAVAVAEASAILDARWDAAFGAEAALEAPGSV